ncbi:hypothetical protein H310_13398 [Aphanomyces invadans]|uniref:Protein MIS12 homolog n=1 Tax=Aphanomyces invadans TaxID=157072 RepID=A0A024TDA3_9STRA|nr:hypothetical protein H310_13398 [Aphanomyces invadans]ETV92145.1 hypothetical protein H310_13398 [Aphanomyces invadans]|eukprot:XP_008879109.1 hypothetical protein H310_13398 [Aphanomyces invadans]
MADLKTTSPPAHDFFGGCSALFMDEVFKAVEDFVDDGMTSLERKLLECHGGPSITSSQAHHIHEGVSNYMDAVRTAFVKNFDKFELYMLRNVFVAPDNIAEIQTAAHAHEHAQSTDSDQWNDANPADVEAELHALRQEFFRATETQRSLLAAKNAVDQQVGDVHAFVADLSFTKDIPKKVGPLGEHVKSAVELRESFSTMKELQRHLNTKSIAITTPPRQSTYETVTSRFHKQSMQVPLDDLVRLNEVLAQR